MSELKTPVQGLTPASSVLKENAHRRKSREQSFSMETKPLKASRLWFNVHSWVGFKLSLFMSFILITGTLAVVSNELDWLTHSSMRVIPQAESEKASWGEIYASLQKLYPDWQFPYIRDSIDPWFTILVHGQTPEGNLRLVDVNPYTAEVQGDRPWLSFQRFFRNSHRHLMLPTKIGVPIVSALAFLLLISLVSGLVVYKKFWRGFFKMPRRHKGKRIFYGDLHRLMSLWSLWFVLLISLTSVFYFAESLGWRAPAFGKIPKIEQTGINLDADTINHYADAVQTVYSGFQIELLLPPQKPGDPLVFQGYPKDGAILVRARASYVAFDPVSGDIIANHHSSLANLHQRIAEMADPLHFGSFGGLPTKLLWFFFGLLMSGLAVTGVVIYAFRIQKSLLPEMSGMAIGWRYMGWWKWLGIAAVVTVVVLLPQTASANSLLL